MAYSIGDARVNGTIKAVEDFQDLGADPKFGKIKHEFVGLN
jgi:hypothetical protein